MLKEITKIQFIYLSTISLSDKTKLHSLVTISLSKQFWSISTTSKFNTVQETMKGRCTSRLLNEIF